MEKKFQKKVEDFVCINCNTEIEGNGYTDHCFKCLYSLHVDINPGDRMSDCRGLMEPVGFKRKTGENIIIYRCQKCSFLHQVKAAKNDNIEELMMLNYKNYKND